ncbi:hypothetical protein Tco_0413128 [Tanacetum coccineum]
MPYSRGSIQRIQLLGVGSTLESSGIFADWRRIACSGYGAKFAYCCPVPTVPSKKAIERNNNLIVSDDEGNGDRLIDISSDSNTLIEFKDEQGTNLFINMKKAIKVDGREDLRNDGVCKSTSCAKDLWEKIILMKQERHYNQKERGASYCHWSSFKLTLKFLNTLPDEWSKFVTDVNCNNEFYQPDSSLVVPDKTVPERGDDPIDAINHMMSFLTAVVTSRYPTTNNQLRTSSNPRQQPTRLPSPDHAWNKSVPSIHESVQPWLSNLAQQDPRESFDELTDSTS